MTNTVVYEMDNFINIFWVNFAEEKKTKFQNITSLVLMWVRSYFKHRVKEQNLLW